jgi:hypothetical protein
MRIDANRPQKMPIVTEQERKFYDSAMLENILLFRRLGYTVTPPKGFPKPPVPQFRDPD